MKVKFKNGSIKLTAEGKKDSEALYRFLSGGKQSLGWFQRRIGKVIVMDGDKGGEITIQDEAHAYHLYDYWQNKEGLKFSDVPESTNT